MKKSFPPGVIRGYFLDIEINSSADDEEYYLCFGKDGKMYILIFHSPNKGYGRGYWSDPILQTEFVKYFVNAVGLIELVCKKLITILPAGAESHC